MKHDRTLGNTLGGRLIRQIAGVSPHREGHVRQHLRSALNTEDSRSVPPPLKGTGHT